MAAFVKSYGLQLVDRSGKEFDVLGAWPERGFGSSRHSDYSDSDVRQQLTAADVIAFYFSAHWCPPCRT